MARQGIFDRARDNGRRGARRVSREAIEWRGAVLRIEWTSTAPKRVAMKAVALLYAPARASRLLQERRGFAPHSQKQGLHEIY
ncbi:MAG: hypothetical protein BGP06_07080 [Rhizobiales bacterium 65-9]|nr:MAG: hypothetical protein BGP06_07080 [Rhizobiales bacterium 65-9]